MAAAMHHIKIEVLNSISAASTAPDAAAAVFNCASSSSSSSRHIADTDAVLELCIALSIPDLPSC